MHNISNAALWFDYCRFHGSLICKLHISDAKHSIVNCANAFAQFPVKVYRWICCAIIATNVNCLKQGSGNYD